MSNTTIKILAKELNLSVATVSKALRDSYEISLDTKKKVLALAKKLNYVANPYASSLRKRRSNTIAVVLPEVADSFFSQAINGIESIANERGYHVLIYLTHENFEREEAILKEFQSGRVDGILISVSGGKGQGDHVREVIDAGVPVVFFDRVYDDVETAKVITDDFECGYRAADHLARQGCRRIAFVSFAPALSISQNRAEGYKKALADHRLKRSAADMIYCCHDNEANLGIIRRALDKERRPDGIIACVEKFTPSIYLACQQLGLRMPEHIKLVSFTNLPTAPILQPALSTITQPAYEMGEAAATVLFKTLLKNNPVLKNETVVIPSTLNIRYSSI